MAVCGRAETRGCCGFGAGCALPQPRWLYARAPQQRCGSGKAPCRRHGRVLVQAGDVRIRLKRVGPGLRGRSCRCDAPAYIHCGWGSAQPALTPRPPRVTARAKFAIFGKRTGALLGREGALGGPPREEHAATNYPEAARRAAPPPLPLRDPLGVPPRPRSDLQQKGSPPALPAAPTALMDITNLLGGTPALPAAAPPPAALQGPKQQQGA